jgi:NTE family protein
MALGPAKDAQSMSQPDKPFSIGLALGAGGARGWAHIGVIEALRELKVPIDIVCGCSSGALVAASYASGRFEPLAELARSMTLLKMASFFDFSMDGGGLIEGRNVLKFFEEHVEDADIEACAVKFGAVATELNSGREIWFTRGSILDAVRASIALPGLMTPMLVNNRWLVDGTLVNPLPASLCWAMGADVVIAVNLSGDLAARAAAPVNAEEDAPAEAAKGASWLAQLREMLPIDFGDAAKAAAEATGIARPSYLEVLANSSLVMHNFITRVRLAVDPVDVLIAPAVDAIGVLEFHKAEAAIEAGRAAVLAQEGAIRALAVRASQTSASAGLLE